MKQEIAIEIEGVENLQQLFEQLPAKLQGEVTINAFKKAAKIVNSAMKQEHPSSADKVKSIIKIRSGRNKMYPSVSVGYYGRQKMYINRRGQKWDPYMLVYWLNYGTYANRDPGHKFIYPRRGRSIDRKGGIMPGKFVDRAVQISYGTAKSSVENELDGAIVSLIKKYALK